MESIIAQQGKDNAEDFSDLEQQLQHLQSYVSKLMHGSELSPK